MINSQDTASCSRGTLSESDVNLSPSSSSSTADKLLSIRIFVWNMRGFGNLADIIKEIKKTDIIALCETHVCETNLPFYFKSGKFSYLIEDAYRISSSGRQKGGLLLLYHSEHYNVELLQKSKYWIFTKIYYSETSFIILGLTYLNENHEELITELHKLISEITVMHPSEIFIIGGDFNCRISNLNQIVKQTCFGSSYIMHQRISKDEQMNSRGQRLVGGMEENGFVVLNGRSEDDYPGKFTCSGRSVIDLLWCNVYGLKFIDKFAVNEMYTDSDHLPICVTLKL